MDYSFAGQDDENGTESVRSRILRRTYDVPSASSPPVLHTAYARSSNIAPQRMPVRTMMYTRDSSSPTRQNGQPSTINPVRRSVSGMKTLLPLKLSSAAPEVRSWPSSAPSQRTTFGMRLSLRIERPTSMSESTKNERGRCQSPQPQPKRRRDTPIYTEPGTPLPSPAYYMNNDVCGQCSPAGSVCDEACIINEYDNEKRRQHAHDLERLQETVEDMCEGEGSAEGSYAEALSRCSDLSFQCSGEDLFEDEASWLRSPLNIQNWPQPNALPLLRDDALPIGRSVETWLSDTSSYFDQEDDELACATILAPAKASIVDVSMSPASGLSIKIPPRTSSLDSTPWPFTAPWNNTRNSWMSLSRSPPITPADGDNSNGPSRESSFSRKFQPMPPQRRLDLAMTSPPLSLNSSPSSKHMAPLNMNGQPTRRPESPAWPLPVENSFSESKEGILSSLEEWTASFPSNMLLPDSACISTIRSQLFTPKPQTGTYHRPTPPRPLLSPFPLDRTGPPRMRSLRRRKTTDLSQHRRPSIGAARCPPLPTSSTSSSTITNHTSHTQSQTPDLQPLYNIFPNASNTMRAALYAHLLAYIFVSSTLSTSLSSFPSAPSPRLKRRDTPYWSSNSPRMSQKAADMLGMPSIPIPNPNSLAHDSDSSVFSSTSHPPEVGHDFNTAVKAQSLLEELRKCIFCLVSVMDENLGMENMMGAEHKDIESSSGMIFLRSLVEVVRSAEEKNAVGPCF